MKPFASSERTLRVVHLGRLPRAVVSWLQRPLSELFGVRLINPAGLQSALDAHFLPPDEGDHEVHDGPRAADEVLDMVVTEAGGIPGWTLALSGFDLVSPGGEPVFGEATVGGCCAVVNAYRMDPASHGLPRNPERFRRRLRAEAMHELGHVAGLTHCREDDCVMAPSESLAELDRKASPCLRCAALLRLRLTAR